ncbi:RNA-directed DNA polymerase (reverse transcriptase)-related family protein [Rhynchospora pubera]|uniref:RNA-directed DNA polymerase (Reverse transcriptase)-related family protein n=1 Tax=Rhynchospora pubera TaxID=906938 RepID=A0AAV8D2L8_9POAL|nr:RNA-directed DNA polymerase (reverse transcriptase)-related family protein [Rhynchospora pubera]
MNSYNQPTIAKFFRGKLDKGRYMTFVAWKSICKPMEQGGLGVRDLALFGDALFLKNVWEMMRQGDKLWVQICQAKYYPKIGFWKATNTSGASSLWRETVKIRKYLQEDVQWEINNGKSIYALSQPWYPNWAIYQGSNLNETVKKVSELINPITGLWNMEELQGLFGSENAAVIQAGIKPPDPQNELQDRLIWHKSKTGRFSVKEGYKELHIPVQQEGSATIGAQWVMINNWKFIAPKVKIFLWRLLSRALPLANNIHGRIRVISPICQRCGQENEYESHCFFFCPGSRRVWFEGRLGLRTHEQSLDITQAFIQTVPLLDEEGIKVYVYTLWELWKGRNEVVMQHKQFDPVKILRAVNNWMRGVVDEQQSQSNQQPLKIPGYEIKRDDWHVMVDASWQQSTKTGLACIMYEQGTITSWSCNVCEAHDPFHAETLAMLEGFNLAVQRLQEDRNKMVFVLSDCQNLVVAVLGLNADNIPSWRAMADVQKLITLYRNWASNIHVKYVRRDAVKPAHILANHARIGAQIRLGNVMENVDLLELGIDLEMDKNYFDAT